VDGRFVLLIGSLGLKDQSRSKANEGEKVYRNGWDAILERAEAPLTQILQMLEKASSFNPTL